VRKDAFEYLNRFIDVSHETFERLFLYHELLHKWQPKINLVGPDTLKDAWSRHFLDSLQLLKLIPDLSTKMADLGSGAGFPGMALAIVGATDMHLVESDTRKISFLREVARVTSTKVEIHHCRIENCPVEKVDIIVSRACSDLDTLLSFSDRYVSHETICLFHKGKNYSKDIVDANIHWLFDYDVVPSVTDTQGVILKLAHFRKRGV